MQAFVLSLVLTPFLIAGNTLYQVNFFDSGWKDLPRGDCLMVLGAKVLSNNQPDLMMRERIDTTLEHLDEGYKHIILSGGTVDHKKAEAEVMRELLGASVISDEQIILEKNSTSTYENFVFSKPIVLEKDCENLDVISHDFHLARVKLVADRLEIPINRLIPAQQQKSNSAQRLNREYKAFLWYWLAWDWLKK